MNERLTELIKSTSAALASPSLAGASICTPTASSPISAEPHTHARRRLSKEEEEQQTAVTAEMDALELEGGSETDRTCDGGDLGAGLGVDGYGHGRRRHQAEAAREPSSSGSRGCGGCRRRRRRPFGLASLPRSHLVSERLKWALARFVSELRQKWAHLQPQEYKHGLAFC